MAYKGHVENGVIVLDEPADLQEGAEVAVEVVQSSIQTKPRPTFRERYTAVIGKADGLPEDAAENHDHYLYGAAKK